MDERAKALLEKGELIAYPGLRLCCSDDELIPGDGTYEDQGYIFSSLVGTVKLIEINNERKTQRVEVSACRGGTAMARVGELVTAVVARVTWRAARCELRCASYRPLTRPLKAILRKENVRATEVDRIDMYKSFRPGDIILARVLPITELQCYQLSTSEPELGVVIARAADAPAGVNMIPLSWKEMQCPVTLVKEPRKDISTGVLPLYKIAKHYREVKVAKVVPENIQDMDERTIVAS